jgi:UDP-N-acetylglucosamine 2-epimerase (non-hydrolysing)
MKIISVVGARPNFMKVAPFIHVINDYNQSHRMKIEHILVHTGQHYDDRMSKAFFTALNIPDADINLGVGSGSHAEQVGHTMIAFEKVLLNEKPDWVVVVGDVNATLACSVTAKKLHIKVCHIEAGLRSGDENMPEEINRLVTDRISDLLLTPDTLSSENLIREGIDEDKIQFVGNIMIDTLEKNRETANNKNIYKIVEKNLIEGQSFKFSPFSFEKKFVLMTLHRPSNVDDREILLPLIKFLLEEVSEGKRVFWPIHPRTQKQLKAFNIWEEVIKNKQLFMLHPIGYHEMLKLNMEAKIMLTDSGGLQEECTILGTPCLTLRNNTERPITLKQNGGVSVLVGSKIDDIRNNYNKLIKVEHSPVYPPLWDGKTASRCLKSILNYKKYIR